MEIICAGYPKVGFKLMLPFDWPSARANKKRETQFKTGSKSCSAALRVLGYNVADYLETCEESFQMRLSDLLKIAVIQ